jgi:BolA protein
MHGQTVQTGVAVNGDRIEKIRDRITAALQPDALEILDESHKHIGHTGAKDGRGHFQVTIVAEKFAGLPPIQRHRLVYEAVGDLMDTDIHALSIKASPPSKSS